MLSRRWPGIAATVRDGALSLFFFVTSNFAVWAFSGMYSLDLAGLIQSYVAALPFLDNSIAGDLFWSAVLFGGARASSTAPCWHGARSSQNISESGSIGP